MKALTAALTLHALFGLACLHRAVHRGEWAQSACAFLVASSGVYLAVGMFRALRGASAQFERREKAEKRRRVFRETVGTDHWSGQGPQARALNIIPHSAPDHEDRQPESAWLEEAGQAEKPPDSLSGTGGGFAL